MEIKAFFATREDGRLSLNDHKPEWKGGYLIAKKTHRDDVFSDVGYDFGGEDFLPEVNTKKTPKRVTMALCVGTEDDLQLEVLRKVAECYGGKTIENVIQQLEAVKKEREGKK